MRACATLLPGEIVWCLCDVFYQANFADVLPAEQRVPDALAELGALTLKKEVSCAFIYRISSVRV